MRCAVQFGRLIAETTLHRDHAACVDVHRHERALHSRHLTQRPTDKLAAFGHAAHMHNVASFKVVKEVADQPTNVFARHGLSAINTFDADG